MVTEALSLYFLSMPTFYGVIAQNVQINNWAMSKLGW